MIALDACVGDNTATATSLSWSHVCSSGGNRLLLVGVHVAAATDEILSVTYAGVALTLITSLINYSASGASIYLYCMPAPLPGSNTVTVSLNSSQTVRGSSASYTGVRQSTSPDNFGSASGAAVTAIAKAITPNLDNCWVVGYLRNNLTATVSYDAGTTLRTSTAFSAVFVDNNAAVHPAASTSLGFSWTGATTAAAVVASLAPVLEPPPPAKLFDPRRFSPRRVAYGSTTPAAPAAPAAPNTPSPADGARTLYSALSWVSARGTRFDVFLDTVNPPVAQASIRQVGTSYSAGLSADTRYYWQVIAYNDGGSANGPVWSFTTPKATDLLCLLGGALTANARYGSLGIDDTLNAQPNTGALKFGTAAPSVGERVLVGLGLLDTSRLLFSGEIQSLDPSYEGVPANQVWTARLIDRTFAINKRRPVGAWTDVSVSAIAKYLVAVFAPGFTSAGVSDGLSRVTIAFDGTADFMTCMGRLATLAGCYTDVTYGDDVLLSVAGDPVAPDDVDSAHPPLDQNPVAFATDLSQVRTRVLGRGAGTTVPAALGVGETIVPVSAMLFDAAGGWAIMSGTVLTYAGTQDASAAQGALVGAGQAPTTKPTMLGGGAAGSIDAGLHSWEYAWVTAAGKSLPSPASTAIHIGIAAPAKAPDSVVAGASMSGGPRAGAIKYALAYVDPNGGTQTAATASPVGAATDYTSAGNQHVTISVVVTAEMVGFVVNIARSDDAGATWYANMVNLGAGTMASGPILASQIGNTLTFDDAVFNASTYVYSPPTGVEHEQLVGGIAIGPSGTTKRELYRTAAGGSQQKLVTTINDNTSVQFLDTVADSALGANAPTGDTSGLAVSSGQVNPGSATLQLTSAGQFQSAGGWTISNSKYIRYTGISGNTLTGVPPTGPGAITGAIPYGDQAFPASALTGVNQWNGVPAAVIQGAAINLWVQLDDVAAQAALGAQETDASGNPTDGVREYVLTSDAATVAALTAACAADLARFKGVVVTATYETHDVKTRSGRTVYVNVATGPAGYYVIQHVHISIDGPGILPRYAVTASSTRFLLTDLLQRVMIAG